MSKKIGIVSEGVSDFRTLQHIIERYLKSKEGEEYYAIRLNPKEERNKQIGFGTWQGVFRYISGQDDKNLIVEALEEGCEYVMVQIDTDVCEQYQVTHDLTNVEALWKSVRQKLESSVHPEFDKTKLIYAICIDELDRCLNIVNGDLRKKDYFIDKENKNSIGAQKAYEFILKQKKKPKEIKECSEFNYGFKKLIEQLDEISASES